MNNVIYCSALACMRFATTCLVGVLATALAGCEQADFMTCYDANYNSDHPCPIKATSITCEGQCVPLTDSDWGRPYLVWLGDYDTTVTCPLGITEESGFTGYSGLLTTPPKCGPCDCGRPEVTCELPTHFTVSTATCPGDAAGAIQVLFDAPDAWDGTCNADQSLAPEASCNGQPCVASLTVEPPVAVSTACEVISPPPAAPPRITWMQKAFGCSGLGKGWCDDPRQPPQAGSSARMTRCRRRGRPWPRSTSTARSS
jgi:hypothetical protein